MFCFVLFCLFPWFTLSPFLCPLVPKMSLTAEGLSWLSQLYYFQHHDHNIQELIYKLGEAVVGINNYLMLKEVTVCSPS